MEGGKIRGTKNRMETEPPQSEKSSFPLSRCVPGECAFRIKEPSKRK